MSVISRGWFGVRHYNDVEVNLRFSDASEENESELERLVKTVTPAKSRTVM